MKGLVGGTNACRSRKWWRLAAAQPLLDGLDQPGAQRPVGIALSACIEHQQIVARDAVARRVDSSIDDVCPTRRQGGADAIEQALAIGRENADPRRAGFGIILDDDARLGITDARFGGSDLL